MPESRSLQLRAFGQTVSELRAAQAMSVDALATATRRTPRHIERLEAGVVDVRYDLLVALMDALNAKPSQLAGRTEELEAELKHAGADRQREQVRPERKPETK